MIRIYNCALNEDEPIFGVTKTIISCYFLSVVTFGGDKKIRAFVRRS